MPTFKRLHLFEFCDQPWLRGSLREGYLDCLNFVHHVYQPYHRLAGPLAEWTDQNSESSRTLDKAREEVLDIASGSGEQIAMLLGTGAKQGLHLPKFILSDLYPDPAAWRALQEQFGKDAIGHIEQPLSVFDMRTEFRRWSIFSAFHHFQPEAAKALLQEFVRKGDRLCILEMTTRKAFCLLLMVAGLPAHLIVPFFAKRFGWRKFLFTTIIPIVPLMVTFDGVVSALRSYTKEEIIAMLPSGSEDEFTIEYREVWWRFSPLKATMFSLVRKEPATLKGHLNCRPALAKDWVRNAPANACLD